MNLEQYKIHGKKKKKFKVLKKDEVRYTLADSMEHCQSKFNSWTSIEVSDKEFENNYPFNN